MPPHCDTLDGPVVNTAREALSSGDVTLVLPWIPEQYEQEVREAFQETLEVRELGDKARDLADYWFFETCVRVHRIWEGAPYTGLKPAGLDEGPAVEAADRSMEEGSVDGVLDLLDKAVKDGVRQKFEETMTKRTEANQSLQAGRQWVSAYVEYIHYVKAIYDTAMGEISHEE